MFENLKLFGANFNLGASESPVEEGDTFWQEPLHQKSIVRPGITIEQDPVIFWCSSSWPNEESSSTLFSNLP